MKAVMRPRIDLLAVFAGLYLVFLYGPVLLLPLFSFNDSIFVSFPLKGFTLKWYSQMIENAALRAAFANSVKVGISVSVISTILGTLAAKAVTRYSLPYRGAIVGFIMLPLLMPSIILGIALLMLVMISRLEGFDKSFEEASLDLGASAWSTFWRITFPLALPGIVASLLLCFTTSFDEFLLAFFLAGNQATLPLVIFSQLRLPSQLPSVLA